MLWLTIIRRLLLCYFLVYAAATAAAFYVPVFALDLSSWEGAGFYSLILAFLITSVILLIVRYVDKITFLDLGLVFKKDSIAIFLFGVFLGALAPLIRLLILAMSGEKISFGLLPTVDVLTLLGLAGGTLGVAWYEELVYRGYTLFNLSQRLNRKQAIVVSAAIFVVPHLPNMIGYLGNTASLIDVLTIFFAGSLLGAAFYWQKNIWIPFGIHFANNFVTILLFPDGSGIVGGTGRDFISLANFADPVSVLFVLVLFLYLAKKNIFKWK